MRHPEPAPQQFDVLTMLGFVILVGKVVSNAILIVEQAINFMHPPEYLNQKPIPALEAIAASVRSRVRPIFMTACTTLFGGLAVSTLFTLVLVPLVFSFAVQMVNGVRELRGLGRAGAPVHRSRGTKAGAAEGHAPVGA